MTEEYIQVITTTEREEEAEQIARLLVEKRLAGCVQVVGPVLSTYWWEGRVERGKEWLCFIKSRRELFKELEKAIKQVHPYETPEIIALPITAGSQDYLEWLKGELKPKGC